MRKTLVSGALALCALSAGAGAQAQQVQQAQQAQQAQQVQQAQQAQQARSQAESYLRKEEAAATGRQDRRTDSANQDAAVADEAAGHSDAARPARSADPNPAIGAAGRSSATPPPSYGPVLNPRGRQAADPARQDPAEVRDETDTLTREAPARQRQPQQEQQSQRQQQRRQQQRRQQGDPQTRQTRPRREAWQPAGPLAPRALDGRAAAAIGTGALPPPTPAAAPQPVLPSSAPLNACVGGVCRDAAGNSYQLGPAGSGVNASGRPCTLVGNTVQCL